MNRLIVALGTTLSVATGGIFAILSSRPDLPLDVPPVRYFTPVHGTAVHEHGRTTAPDGDLRLEGQLQSVDARSNSFVALVTTLTMFNLGGSTGLRQPVKAPAPLPLTVQVSPATTIRTALSPASLTFSKLQPGMAVTVIGPNVRRGQPMPARDIIVSGQ